MEPADIGVFIMLAPKKPSAGMKEVAEKVKKFEYKGKRYNGLQFWQITDDYFRNPIY